MKEVNPMSGYRGCRIGVVENEIYSMQARAIFDAAKRTLTASKTQPNIELIVPIVSVVEELDYLQKEIISPESDKAGYDKYKTGIMVELPSICMLGKEIGPEVETCSFGTNDLTQMALGLSRDDSGRFLEAYRKAKIFRANPFLNVQEPVKRLIRRFVDDAVRSNPDLKLGVCGAHARDSDSISFFEGLGFEYLSVMPSHVNQTKAAAQTARSKKLSGD